jgi:hypothetical protein
MNFTDSQITLIHNLVNREDDELVELINHFKPYVAEYWDASNIDEKDDPEVQEAFDRLNSIREILRDLRARRKNIADLNKTLKLSRKFNQWTQE